MDMKRGLVLIITVAVALGVAGCGGGGDMQERRAALDKSQQEEQEALLKESMVTIDTLPTADKEGEDFSNITRPPKSFRTDSDINKSADGDFGTVEYVTTASLDEIKSFYKDESSKGGWKETENLEKSLRGYPGALLGYENDKYDLKIDIAENKTKDGKNFYLITIKHYALRK